MFNLHIETVLAITTENKEFEQNLKYRVVCDVCIFWLGASLEQFAQEGPVAIAYAFRFPISLEENYSVNELELLGLYGQSNTPIINCTVKKTHRQSDHQFITSALNASEKAKTSKKSLTRWIDRF